MTAKAWPFISELREARTGHSLLALLGLVALTLGPLTWVEATPITIQQVDNFRDTRGENSVGLMPGDRNQFGAGIVPAAGSTITAVQDGFTVGPRACTPLTLFPTLCQTSVAFSASHLGSWTLTFQNGTDTAVITTPTLAGAETPAPFPSAVTITRGSHPTIGFTMPVGFTPDIFVVRIFDKSAVLPSGAVDVIFSQVVSPRATSFTIPSTLTLRPDNPYVISLEVTDLRPGPIGGALRRSVSFFEFRLGGDGGPAVVELPTVGLDPDPTDGFGAPYRFGFTITDPSVVRFLDPLVAIGYDYATGPGNPNFASVIFPGVGDGLFELSFDGTTQTVAAGVTYLFPAGGVSRFSVRGIEASAGLDPGNVTAFVTGLTFTGPGDFTGTMTPVIQLVPGASVQITVNQSSVASGQTLTVGVQANNPAGQPSADLFVGVLLPDGLTAVFLSPSGAFIGSGSVVHPAAFVPLQLVPGGSSVSLPTLLALTLPAGGAVPAGVYTVFGALVRAGALIDDRIDPGDIVAIDLKSVTVTQ